MGSTWAYYFKSKLKGLLFAYYPRQPVDLSWPSKCTIHSLKLRCFICMQYFTLLEKFFFSIWTPFCVPISSKLFKFEKKVPIGHLDRVPINSILFQFEIFQVLI